MVGQEDKGRPLIDFAPLLAAADAPLYFHAGETATVGGAADLNLVDAHLLGSKRLGHGYALAHHPRLRAAVKAAGIALEVCPLSNQVLMLVDDLRNHPLATFMSEDLPVTLAPDDPALWGAVGASHDWAMAYLAMDDRAGLAALKQLAQNSIDFSALPAAQKNAAKATWANAWDAAVATIAKGG